MNIKPSKQTVAALADAMWIRHCDKYEPQRILEMAQEYAELRMKYLRGNDDEHRTGN